MGVYAHRFIEVLDKDNQWHLLPIWSKYKESSYSQPDLVADDLKLTKHHCFLRRSSSGFYSPGSMYSVDDISHPIAQSELSDETREYIEHYDWPVRTECFLLSELEAFADKCQEQIYSHLADAFHDRNMLLIIKMLANATNTSKQTEVEEDDYYRSPRSTFDDYLEDYLSVMSEVFKIHFLNNEIDFYYDPAKVRVVFFYA